MNTNVDGIQVLVRRYFNCVKDMKANPTVEQVKVPEKQEEAVLKKNISCNQKDVMRGSRYNTKKVDNGIKKDRGVWNSCKEEEHHVDEEEDL